MRKIFMLAFFLISMACDSPEEHSFSIHLNSVGFLPAAEKQATIIGQAKQFILKQASDNTIVFEGKTTGPFHQDDVNQETWIADFSVFSKEGEYYLELPDGSRSVSFQIGKSVYNPVYYTTMRAFYLWRCGTAVKGMYQGEHFAHGACHMDDGYDDFIAKEGGNREGTKGWHDAGDYGKYTVNAGITIGMLFMAWDQFKDRLETISLDLPETAPGFPDFLKELKWETDWLLTMQYPDGSGRVSHKLTRINFAPFIVADKDTAKRYFTPWSSAATADFVAMMAQAARYFQPYDKTYAVKCLDAAILSYQFLKDNPGHKRFEQGKFKTGGYQSKDEDDRLWAAVEMWLTTGSKAYLNDFEEQAREMNFEIDENWDWGDVSNLGMFAYVLADKEEKDSEVLEAIKQNIQAVAGQIVEQAETDVYNRPLGGRYYWGCNGTVARQVMNLQVAYQLFPDRKYRSVALDAIGHLLGRNYYNRSFITGIGINPPKNPHDRRSGADGIENPWPGYLVGGGHSATGWHDEEENYETNEIAINWQAALVYAFAGFVQ